MRVAATSGLASTKLVVIHPMSSCNEAEKAAILEIERRTVPPAQTTYYVEPGFADHAFLREPHRKVWYDVDFGFKAHHVPDGNTFVFVGGLINVCLPNIFSDFLEAKIQPGEDFTFYFPLDAIGNDFSARDKTEFVTEFGNKSNRFLEWLRAMHERRGLGCVVTLEGQAVFSLPGANPIALKWFQRYETVLTELTAGVQAG